MLIKMNCMGLVQVNQKTKIIFDANDRVIEMDCYVEKVYYDRIALALPKSFIRYSEFLRVSNEIKVSIFSYAGIISLNSIIITSPMENEFTVEYDPDNIEIKNARKSPRYSSSCEITIFRPLIGNIETRLIDISTRGVRFYSDFPIEAGTEYDCRVTLPGRYGKILFKGKILDNKGLPAGVYRMLIDKIAYKDKQLLFDYCSSLGQ